MAPVKDFSFTVGALRRLERERKNLPVTAQSRTRDEAMNRKILNEEFLTKRCSATPSHLQPSVCRRKNPSADRNQAPKENKIGDVGNRIIGKKKQQ